MAKTVKVAKVLELANKFLNTNASREKKEGVESLLKAILFETENYDGFYYPEVNYDERTMSYKLADGTTITETGENKWNDQVRQYYVSRKLK